MVRESLVNQDGKTDTITTPSSQAQLDLINECHYSAGLDPRDTPYVEAHMTGKHRPPYDPVIREKLSDLVLQFKALPSVTRLRLPRLVKLLADVARRKPDRC